MGGLNDTQLMVARDVGDERGGSVPVNADWPD